MYGSFPIFLSHIQYVRSFVFKSRKERYFTVTNELLTFLFFFVPIVLFALSMIIFYAVGIIKRDPEMTELSLVSLISFSLSVFASDFFYDESSMRDMVKAITFSSINDIIPFAMVLFAFIIMVIEILKKFFLVENF